MPLVATAKIEVDEIKLLDRLGSELAVLTPNSKRARLHLWQSGSQHEIKIDSIPVKTYTANEHMEVSSIAILLSTGALLEVPCHIFVSRGCHIDSIEFST